jgi:hypothetical protein
MKRRIVVVVTSAERFRKLRKESAMFLELAAETGMAFIV